MNHPSPPAVTREEMIAAMEDLAACHLPERNRIIDAILALLRSHPTGQPSPESEPTTTQNQESVK